MCVTHLRTDVGCAIFQIAQNCDALRISHRWIKIPATHQSRERSTASVLRRKPLVEILREGTESSRFRSTAITCGVGKGVPFTASLRGCGEGGHAEPVIGPAEGRTRWLCPPYAASSSSGRGVLAISQDLKTDIRVGIPTHDLATGNNIGW